MKAYTVTIHAHHDDEDMNSMCEEGEFLGFFYGSYEEADSEGPSEIGEITFDRELAENHAKYVNENWYSCEARVNEFELEII